MSSRLSHAFPVALVVLALPACGAASDDQDDDGPAGEALVVRPPAWALGAAVLDDLVQRGRGRSAEPGVLLFQCTVEDRPLCRDARGLFDEGIATQVVGGLGAVEVARARGAQVTVRCVHRGARWACAADRGGGSEAVAVR